MQENNIFYKRINRFSKNTRFEKETFEVFDFNNNLKSDKIEELEFTNFLSSDKSQKYFNLLNICDELMKKNISINKLFIFDEFDSSKYNAKRVYEIINKVNNSEINPQKLIYKLKSKDDPAIQFYILKEGNRLKLELIDVYHLVIKAINKKTGKVNAKQVYIKRKKCNYNIINIANKLAPTDKPF